MADLSSRDRALALIDHIIDLTLKGKIRSNGHIYRLLVEGIEPGTGELFERCLGDRQAALEREQALQTDELKLAKSQRRLRALHSITTEWQRWQAEHAAIAQVSQAVTQLEAATAEHLWATLATVMDPNRDRPLTLSQWQELAKTLPQQATQATDPDGVQAIALGLSQGLATWQELEGHLVSWIYDQAQGAIGFGQVPGQNGPWATWSQVVSWPWLKEFLQTLALEGPVVDWIAAHPLTLTDWVRLLVVWRCLQQGLVSWFDQRVYESKVGAKLSISTYLAFAVLWSQIALGLQRSPQTERDRAVDATFQVTLQSLRTFAQRDYFPLYGGLFASFSGQYLQRALDYLDVPLRLATGSLEKGRILTLLGYSQRARGDYAAALAFHQDALEVAQAAGDRPSEIANLNHLSRTYVAQKAYDEAVSFSQRALILARQVGDRPGEANALANLGYAEIFRGQQQERLDAETAQQAISQLQDGLKLTERLGDRQSQALCLSSLGVAYLMQGQSLQAVPYLEGGIQAAQFSGDLYLQSINWAYLAEAYYQRQQFALAVYAGALGMYGLYQLASTEWQQPAGLLTVLRGAVGVEAFQGYLTDQRSRLMAAIGVDGYDAIPELLERRFEA